MQKELFSELCQKFGINPEGLNCLDRKAQFKFRSAIEDVYRKESEKLRDDLLGNEGEACSLNWAEFLAIENFLGLKVHQS